MDNIKAQKFLDSSRYCELSWYPFHISLPLLIIEYKTLRRYFPLVFTSLDCFTWLHSLFAFVSDLGGTPVVSPEASRFLGQGRHAKPLASAQDKPILSLEASPWWAWRSSKQPPVPPSQPRDPLPPPPAGPPRPAYHHHHSPNDHPNHDPGEPPPPPPEPTTPCPHLSPGTLERHDEDGNPGNGLTWVPECYPEEGKSAFVLLITHVVESDISEGVLQSLPGAVNEAHNFRSKQASFLFYLATLVPYPESKFV